MPWMPIGRLNKSVALQYVTRSVTTEGYVDTWATYATVRASVEPATAALVERQVGNTITAPVTHVVTIWHRASRAEDAPPVLTGHISVKDRVLYKQRALYIAGIQNPQEADRQLVLACEERAA